MMRGGLYLQNSSSVDLEQIIRMRQSAKDTYCVGRGIFGKVLLDEGSYLRNIMGIADVAYQFHDVA